MNIDERLDALELAVAELKKVATAYSIDKNNYITKMTQKTKAAVGTKVAYNSSGLVYKNEPLDESDIPQLSMDKITGLQKSLDNKAPSASIDAINTLCPGDLVCDRRKRLKNIAFISESVINNQHFVSLIVVFFNDFSSDLRLELLFLLIFK